MYVRRTLWYWLLGMYFNWLTLLTTSSLLSTRPHTTTTTHKYGNQRFFFLWVWWLLATTSGLKYTYFANFFSVVNISDLIHNIWVTKVAMFHKFPMFCAHEFKIRFVSTRFVSSDKKLVSWNSFQFVSTRFVSTRFVSRGKKLVLRDSFREQREKTCFVCSSRILRLPVC